MEENNICFSGGAKGSDVQWGACAKRIGHSVIHYTFAGHRPFTRDNLVKLTSAQLLEADPYLVKAAPKLKKYYRSGRDPEDIANSTPNLLRRNWWQVKDADRVYAISTIKDGIVQGGTAWAVQMFLDRHGGGPCEAYVYDQAVGGWFQWSTPEPLSSFVGWYPIESVRPPRPHGRYAGIGTREISVIGMSAMRKLMQ